MKIGERGLNILKKWEKGPEGESPCLYAYVCSGGKWTIGWGHTGSDVVPGMTCNVQQALNWLGEDCRRAEKIVNTRVKVPLTQNQFDALVCFVFNIGGGHFVEDKCTLLRLLNKGLYSDAANEFGRWVHAKGKRLSGLVERRRDEESLFRS